MCSNTHRKRVVRYGSSAFYFQREWQGLSLTAGCVLSAVWQRATCELKRVSRVRIHFIRCVTNFDFCGTLLFIEMFIDKIQPTRRSVIRAEGVAYTTGSDRWSARVVDLFRWVIPSQWPLSDRCTGWTIGDWWLISYFSIGFQLGNVDTGLSERCYFSFEFEGEHVR